MSSEQLSQEDRREALGDMVGIMLHRAVAEGAVGMMQVTEPGTPEHGKWSRVARNAMPLARDFITEAEVRYEARHSGETPAERLDGESPEPALSDEARRQKQERLAELEAEATRLRGELGQ
ncbi:hypothetical protein HY379_00165 [Candidatus Saccharibacteria bacterium]|nr:hypothetical protein [Candidatus Saccharibacteria bacterium]